MRCIFCKSDSSFSKSVEHIIPESLGNVEHILPPGVVCDKCNNYFSLKIEKQMLEQPYFFNIRFRQGIESKKGRTPLGRGLSITPRSEVAVGIEVKPEKQIYHVIWENDKDLEKAISQKHGSIMIPIIPLPQKDNKIISRFIGKVGIEVLASRFLDHNEDLDGLIDDSQLDFLINYVRYGKPDVLWPYNMRRIYDEDKRFYEDDFDFQVLHEFKLLFTEFQELYIIVCIFGVEYSMNLGGPELEGYHIWLKEHNYKSPFNPEFITHITRSNLDKWNTRNKKKIKKKF